MIVLRILLFLSLCVTAHAQTSDSVPSPANNGKNGVSNSNTFPESIPNFNHAPGSQNSIPAPESTPTRNPKASDSENSDDNKGR